jgi:predicted dehydrogenase
MQEFEITYLVDVSEDRINYLKNRLKVDGEPDTDYKEVLSDKEVEAVMILTPPKLHHRMVIEAAEAGKHVFCEKPFAMNAKEAEEMIKACEENNVKIMAGFNFRFVPQFRKIKELIDKGFFGTLIGGHSTLFGNAYVWPSVSKFQYKKVEGGGALFEMGAHHIDLMNWFFGDANSVIAKITALTNDKIDDTASVYIQYKNGANCIVYVGWNRLSVNTVTVIGLDGYATASANKNEILYYRKDLVGQAPIRINVKKGLSPYHEEMRRFYEFVRKKKAAIMTGDEIINSVRVIEKAYESNELGRLVSLSNLGGGD